MEGAIDLLNLWCWDRFLKLKVKARVIFYYPTCKGGLHFTVICCTNKCTINERYIPEHRNKLNIYDLQNYDFFANFFNRKKFVKFVKF